MLHSVPGAVSKLIGRRWAGRKWVVSSATRLAERPRPIPLLCGVRFVWPGGRSGRPRTYSTSWTALFRCRLSGGTASTKGRDVEEIPTWPTVPMPLGRCSGLLDRSGQFVAPMRSWRRDRLLAG